MTDDELPEEMPTFPGYYCYDEDLEAWVRLEALADMLFYRLQHNPPCMCRVVFDPIDERIV